MLEKTKNLISLVLVIIGVGGSVAGAFGSSFIKRAEAEQVHKEILTLVSDNSRKIDSNTDRISSTEYKLLDLQLVSLKGNYYILSGKSSLTEAEQLDLEIIKTKILELEKKLASQ